jgi:hypothetical protein
MVEMMEGLKEGCFLKREVLRVGEVGCQACGQVEARGCQAVG